MRVGVFLVLVVVAIHMQVVPTLRPVFLPILVVAGCSSDIPCNVSLRGWVRRERAEGNIITGGMRSAFLVELSW